MQRDPDILGFGDAFKFLEVSSPYFCWLIDRYDIPSQKAARGRIFFRDDLEAVQKARKEKNEPIFDFAKKRPKIYGQMTAAKLIGVSQSRFLVLLKNYEIPHYEISGGRVFFEADLKAFMKSEKRQGKMKHGRGKLET